MTPFAFVNIITTISAFFIAIFAIIKSKPIRLASILFAILNICIGLWTFGLGMTTIVHTRAQAVFWQTILYIGAIFIPVLFLHFIDNFMFKKVSKSILYIIYGASVFFLGTYFIGKFSDVGPIMSFNYYSKPGFFYPYFTAAFVLTVIYTYYIIFSSYRYLNIVQKNQIKYIIIASVINYIGGGLMTFLPVFGINIYPFGVFLLPFFSVLLFYAIVRHHLMDINVVIRKGLVYSTLVAIVTGLYIAFLNFSNQLIVKGNIQFPFTMSPVSALPLLTTIAYIFLGFVVLYRGSSPSINRSFFLLCLATAVYQISGVMLSSYPDTHLIMFYVKLCYTGVCFIPATFSHFIFNFSGYPRKNILIVFYLISFAFLGILWSGDLFINGYYGYNWSNIPKAGLLHPLFMIFAAFVYYFCLAILIRAYRAAKEPNRKNQLGILLLATTIYGFIAMDFIINYGYAKYPPGDVFLITSFAVFVYAIFRHNLMDLTHLLKKGIFYSVALGLISGAYLAFVYVFGYLVKNVSNAFSVISSALLIVMLAIIFQPLRDRIQDIIDTIFFRGKYDYQRTIRDLSLAARSIAGIDQLLEKVIDSIIETLKVSSVSIYLLDKEDNQYILRRSAHAASFVFSIDAEHPLIKYICSKKEAILLEDIKNNSDPTFEFMKKINAEIMLPIMSRQELIGIFCLGEKLSGESYGTDDIDLLSTLCNQMGISIENAMLYEDAMDAQNQMYMSDKLATVGMLAASLAHEIKNPIAAIKGFTHVIDKAVDEKDEEVIKDFKSVVPRQLDRINEIVEKLLTLSRPQRLKKERTDLNSILDEIIKLVQRQAMRQKVAIRKKFTPVPYITADSGQLTQAFLNLTLNAIQSMPSGGSLQIMTYSDNKSITIVIEDSGEGIPPDKIEHVFDPFYTTKTTGSGLGLAVTKKIIQDRHGRIEVESKVGKGSKFIVELPLAGK